MSQQRKLASAKQIQLIHIAKAKLGMDDEAYRALLHDRCRVASSKDLTFGQASRLIDELKRKGGIDPRKGRPRNMQTRDRKNYSQVTRARQLEKIEALLTVGGKSWSYADALAQRICKVDVIAWVPDHELYKIITALRKQAQREGWDLSGEE